MVNQIKDSQEFISKQFNQLNSKIKRLDQDHELLKKKVQAIQNINKKNTQKQSLNWRQKLIFID